MSLIADGLLVATCLTTAIYCLVLSRRLRRLTDTGDGIGKQIVRLNSVLDETRVALAEIRSTSKSATDLLSRDVEAAKRQGSQLQRTIARAAKIKAASSPGVSPFPAGSSNAAKSARKSPAGSMKDDVDEDGLDDMFDHAEREDTEIDEADYQVDAGDDASFDSADVDYDADDSGADVSDPDFDETGDVSEASDHWPFEEGEEGAAPGDGASDSADQQDNDSNDIDDIEADGIDAANAKSGKTRPANPARQKKPEAEADQSNDMDQDQESGVLRIKRMAI